MTKNQFWVIADIHGRYDQLMNVIDLITKYGYNLSDSNQELIQLGDKNDRGPDTYKIFEWFLQQYNKFPNQVHMILGNHERMLIDAAKGTSDLMYYNGGKATLHSYAQATGRYGRNELYNMLNDCSHWDFLQNHMLFLETPDYFFCHAPQAMPIFNELPIGADFRESEQALTWTFGDGRPVDEWVEPNLISREDDAGYKICVYGHIHSLRAATIKELLINPELPDYVTEHPKQIGHAILLDSGAGCHKDAVLSCLSLPDKTIYQSNGKIWKL